MSASHGGQAQSELKVGAVVVPRKLEERLHGGSGFYDFAVVVSLEPLVLVSGWADMRWSATVKAENFRAIGMADPAQLKLCQTRLES